MGIRVTRRAKKIERDYEIYYIHDESKFIAVEKNIESPIDEVHFTLIGEYCATRFEIEEIVEMLVIAYKMGKNRV
jgi:hypothetical protein